MNAIIKLIRFIFQNKGKIFITLFLTIFFLLLFFPFKDLNDFVSSKVTQLTQRSMYFDFEDMNLNPLTASVTLDKAVIETSQYDGITMDSVSFKPSLFSLIKKQPGGHLQITGIMGGDLNLQLSSENQNGQTKSFVQIDGEKISLKKIRDTLNLSIPLSGALSLNSKATVDLTFNDQPDGDVTINISQFEMSSANVNLPDLGQLVLPEIKFKNVELKGHLSGGKLIIENAKLGQPTDELSGNIKGELGLKLMNMNGQIVPMIGEYNIAIDLVAKPAFKERASFFLSFLDNYKSDEMGASRYKFKLHATNINMPPQFIKN